jgi:hypothetical protein
MSRPLVTAKDLEALRGAPPEGAMLTPLARDAMRRRGLSPELARAPDDGRARRLVIATWKRKGAPWIMIMRTPCSCRRRVRAASSVRL